MAERLFTDEQLCEMSTPTLNLAISAMESGDVEKAKKLCIRAQKEFQGVHDLFRDWVAALLSHVYSEYGNDALESTLRQTVSVWQKPISESLDQQNTRRTAQLFAGAMRGHLTPFSIQEDDEKFTFTVNPCGTGGRLALEGSYGPPKNFSEVKKAQPMTFNNRDFPVYCAHCFFQNVLPAEWGYRPAVVTIPSDQIGHKPCRMCLYKKPAEGSDKSV